MRRPAENIDHATNADIAEAGGPDHLQILLDEERSRDSTCPEVDVVHRIVGQRLLDNHVGDL
jgi:hypothetical protein